MTHELPFPTRGSRPRGVWVVAAVPLVFGLVIGAACRRAAGPSLGAFFGPLLITSVVAPYLALMERRWALRAVSWAALVGGVSVVWLFTSTVAATDVVRCSLVVAAYVGTLYALVVCLAGQWTELALPGPGSHAPAFSRGLKTRASPSGENAMLQTAARRGGKPEAVETTRSVLAAFAVASLGLAWLTWPVWLSPALTGPGGEKIVAWLTPAHPLLAVNGVLRQRFDAWDRYPLAYQQLTTLNQDVIYSLPRGVGPAVALHAALALAAWLSGRKNRPRAIIFQPL